MRRRGEVVWACLLGLLLTASWAFAQQGPEYKEGELLIRFKSQVTSQALSISHAALGSQVMKQFRKTGVQLVKLRAGLTTKEAIELYNEDPGVEYAEPNYRLYALDVFPNDPMFLFPHRQGISYRELVDVLLVAGQVHGGQHLCVRRSF